MNWINQQPNKITTPTPQGNDVSTVVFRSGYERELAKQMPPGTKFESETIEWHDYPVGHKCDDCGSKRVYKVRKYTPDFVLPDGRLLETKGNFTTENRKKHRQIKKQHPDLPLVMIFMSDNKISPKSNTRYSEWCEKYGIDYLVIKKGGSFPPGWL